MFGADEPNYATMKDGKRLLGETGVLRTNDMRPLQKAGLSV